MKPGSSVSYFKLQQQIGGGGFGQIWKVQNTEDDQFYAMKIESSKAQRHTLNFETSIIKKLQFSDKFPKYIQDGQEDDFYFLVMELCGPNLNMIQQRLPNKKFNTDQMRLLFAELLTVMEQFHRTGYVHRDIKPQNICARFSGSSPLCLIDYGVSKLFMTSNNEHITARDHAAAIGSPLYSSPNVADHVELSRRDDLYSLAYSIMDVCGVNLPWRGYSDPMESGRIKKENPLSKLLQPFGQNFSELGGLIDSLGYSDSPNYQQMRELAMKGAPQNCAFQWMTAQPQNLDFAAVAQQMKFNFDRNGFLLEMCPYMMRKRGKCNIC
ncbi:Casein kinase I isoform alpha [Tritrichomonas foetus]|uniref:Casein kinase I isoform alpha n=1 Tax=Tritrichomonas foetus TaxID=1144522 RepID=A0A1J4JP11_9EUKA|nr:Casein kinase I isoform alpha [Tritrichomonas foetus]|eukprot:OHT00466.1 Casein kinase I isoform alpha [Tritrichomonas foetus]